MAQTPIVVAIVNTNPDLVRLLRMSLERAGFVVFEMHIEDIKLGSADVSSFLEQHDPKVIVYDIAPPYDMNWRFLDHLRTATGFKGRHFVLTSVNVRHVEDLVGNDESVYEILGGDEDIAPGWTQQSDLFAGADVCGVYDPPIEPAGGLGVAVPLWTTIMGGSI